MIGRPVLVTGFGPFPHVRVNPTAELARQVARRLNRAGIAAEPLVLETSYAGGLPALRARLAAAEPRAVLMLGLAARSRAIRVELFGRGRSSRLHADAQGAGPASSTHSGAGPWRTSASAGMALSRFRRAGLRSRYSPSAGRYLCDAGYALALRATGPRVPVLFIHIPWLRPAPGTRRARAVAGFRPRAHDLAAALTDLARHLAVAGPR